jgi:type I restriction enzyme R subunit
VQAQAMVSIQLEDSDAEVDPVPTSTAGGKQEAELDLLSAILNNFNDLFGNIEWSDADNVRRQIAEIPAMVAKDEKYQNAMKNSDKQNARIESERALKTVMFNIMADNMELFKQFNDDQLFKKWLSDMVFNLTYDTTTKSLD